MTKSDCHPGRLMRRLGRWDTRGSGGGGGEACGVNFDARVELVDGGSGKTLGTWKVDKNSWALGGGIAATQTPEGFMQEAASKIGTELSTKRKEGQVKRPASD